jgi:hypothetical protein
VVRSRLLVPPRWRHVGVLAALAALTLTIPAATAVPASAHSAKASGSREARALLTADGDVTATAAEVRFDEPALAGGSDAIEAAESYVINHASAGSLLVTSLFRMDAQRFALNLVNAARRGVHVEVLLNGGNGCTRHSGCPHAPVQQLLALNRLNDPQTWLRTCDGGTPADREVATSAGRGCIGQALNHNKFLAVSSTLLGGDPVSSLVLQTSTNNVSSQYRHAWNDAMLLNGSRAVYLDYLRYFRMMTRAAGRTAATKAPYFTPRTGTAVDTSTIAQNDIETWSFPTAPSDDPVAGALHRIRTAHRCANPVTEGASGPSRTHVYAAVAFVGGRPLLMKELVTLQDSGCDVQLIYTTISRHDRKELTAAGVQLFQACTPADTENNETSQYLHSKFFLVDGSDTTVGANRRLVYTGSENWNDQSLSKADNRMLRYVEPAEPATAGSTTSSSSVFDAYLARWQQLRAAVQTNGQPTADTCHGATDY